VGPGSVHATQMLCKEVFAVEVVVAARGCLLTVVGVALAHVAAVVAKLKVLGRDMSFPFVLGTEGGMTAVVDKATDEGAGRV
jgi:hypothetical protein